MSKTGKPKARWIAAECGGRLAHSPTVAPIVGVSASMRSTTASTSRSWTSWSASGRFSRICERMTPSAGNSPSGGPVGAPALRKCRSCSALRSETITPTVLPSGSRFKASGICIRLEVAIGTGEWRRSSGWTTARKPQLVVMPAAPIATRSSMASRNGPSVRCGSPSITSFGVTPRTTRNCTGKSQVAVLATSPGRRSKPVSSTMTPIIAPCTGRRLGVMRRRGS